MRLESYCWRSQRMNYETITGVRIIGIGHKARHGKDVTANAILEKLERSAKKYSFADDLKAFARVLGMRSKDGPLLQALGTNVLRRLNSDIWIECLYTRLQEEQPTTAIISDVRFPNEAQFIKDLGGIMIRVDRYNPDDTLFISPDRPADHPSETALDGYKDWDFILTAKDGRVDLLTAAAHQLVEQFLGTDNHVV